MGTDASYWAWPFRVPDGGTDRLIAELAAVGFEGFEEFEGSVVAYVPESGRTPAVERAVSRAAQECGVEALVPRLIRPTNWNAEWERSVKPIASGPFLVHPPWHRPTGEGIPICIEPKMSFGTGHHETTRLMLRLLPDVVRPGDRVLDAGTGTGVLGIAALKVGAASAVGFDNDPWSVRNALENVAVNGLSDRFRIVEGSIEVLPDGEFDVILANINRNVLLALLPPLVFRLPRGGRLVLSGILRSDREVMRSALDELELLPLTDSDEGDWCAIGVQRP